MCLEETALRCVLLDTSTNVNAGGPPGPNARRGALPELARSILQLVVAG